MRGQHQDVTTEMPRAHDDRDECACTPGSSQQVRVLLLCRDRLAAWLFAQSLPPCIRSTHSEAAEEALHRGRLSDYAFALVDCDLPDSIFQRLHGYRHPDHGSIRVIGLRGRDSWRPMKLLAERMIFSYVRMPMPAKVVHALIGHRPLPTTGARMVAQSSCASGTSRELRVA